VFPSTSHVCSQEETEVSWSLTRKTAVLAVGYLIILGVLAIDLIFTVIEIQNVANDLNQAIHG